jgi:hypothetical protein
MKKMSSGPHHMDQQNNNRKRKDLRQILKEPKLKHKNNPVGQETDSTQYILYNINYYC